MASEVYTVVEITLQDGEDVELRPLPIAQLRKFMKVWTTHLAELSAAFEEKGEAALTDESLNDKQYDVYIKLASLALERTMKDTRTTKEFENYLGDVLDEPTIFKILEVCGGLKLGKASPESLIPTTGQTEQ